MKNLSVGSDRSDGVETGNRRTALPTVGGKCESKKINKHEQDDTETKNKLNTSPVDLF